MLETLKNKLDKLAKKTNQMTDQIIVSEHIRHDRLSICNLCEHRIESVNVCSKCGCFLPAKTKLAMSKCPIGKWHSIFKNNK